MSDAIDWPLLRETFPDLDFHSTEALDGALVRMVKNSRERKKQEAEQKRKDETLAFLKAREAARRGVRVVSENTAPKRGWRNVLGVRGDAASLADVDAAYRALAAIHHPDRGGDPAIMAELNVAREQARKALPASGIDARSGETEGLDPKGESPVPERQTPKA